MALPPYTFGLNPASAYNDPTTTDLQFQHDMSVVADNLRLFPASMRGKPNFMAMARAILNQIQGRADENFNLALMGQIDMAVGDLLDKWGENVGEFRGQFYNDDRYRSFVKARAMANRGDGTVDELLDVFELVTRPNFCVEYILLPPGGMQLQVFRPSWMDEYHRGRVRRLMEDAAPGGRTLLLVESVIGSRGPFRADGKTSATGPLPRII